jgi:acyl carrier protein
MAYDAVAPQSLQKLKEMDFKQRGILPAEGIDVFRRVLGGAYPHVMVSTSDYLMSGHRDLSQLYLQRAKTRDTFAHLHARPNLGSAYAPPANPTEERLTEILNDLLGVADIGVEDNFFELGGDSLIGTQLIARLRTLMGVNLPTQSIYLHPTIRTFGVAVEEALITQSSAAKLDEALREVKRI